MPHKAMAERMRFTSRTKRIKSLLSCSLKRTKLHCPPTLPLARTRSLLPGLIPFQCGSPNEVTRRRSRIPFSTLPTCYSRNKISATDCLFPLYRRRWCNLSISHRAEGLANKYHATYEIVERTEGLCSAVEQHLEGV